MKSRWLMNIGLSVGIAVSLAQAESGKPGIEVIDLEPPPRNASLPLAVASTADEAVTEDSKAEPSKELSGKVADIEAKKERRLQSIRDFFGKMKSEDSRRIGRPRAAHEEGETPSRSALRHEPAPSEEPPVDVEPPRKTNATPAVRATPEGNYYRVQRGDTLARIAKKFFGSAQKFVLIADANNLSPTDTIHVGQELLIPSDDEAGSHASVPRPAAAGKPAGKSAARKPAAPGDARPGPDSASAPMEKKPPAKKAGSDGKLDYASYEFKLYQVQAGDTLASVADKFYHGKGDPSLIRLYNNKRDTLKPGEKILIPLPKREVIDKRYEKSVNGVF